MCVYEEDMEVCCCCKMFITTQALEEDGKGRVLVVDGGGSQRCALLGDNIAEMGYKNGWSVSKDPAYSERRSSPMSACLTQSLGLSMLQPHVSKDSSRERAEQAKQAQYPLP